VLHTAIVKRAVQRVWQCRWAVWALAGLTMIGVHGRAQESRDYFRTNCKSCHTIGGGRLAGPDLKGVSQRAPSREWLVNFLLDPKGAIDRGDLYAVKLFEEARRVPMPLAPGMNRSRAERLLDLIDEESAKEESEFKGIQISSEPFTARDVAAGRAIFLGTRKLADGGSACISCHAMHDLPALGGGRLGPDLTKVYNTLQGREKLANWLSAPATETMQPIFKNHPLKADEIHALVAYFENAASHPVSDPATGRVMFLFLGLAAATGLMFGFDAVWKWRFRGVRQPLLQSAKLRGAQ
jgi:mono/diheme cytochrome c family protein